MTTKIDYHISTEDLGEWGGMTAEQVEIAKAKYVEIATVELKNRIDEIDEVVEEQFSYIANRRNSHFDEEAREVVERADAIVERFWIDWLEQACES